MQRKKDYQLEDMVFDVVVWACIIAIVYMDLSGSI
jgi:hypothetical protein